MPYKEPPQHRWEVAGHNEYRIEEILGHRKKGHSYQFLVKWKNYLMNKHMWEPWRHLNNTKDIYPYCQENIGINKSVVTRRRHRVYHTQQENYLTLKQENLYR
jgi:hypothetical protein